MMKIIINDKYNDNNYNINNDKFENNNNNVQM